MKEANSISKNQKVRSNVNGDIQISRWRPYRLDTTGIKPGKYWYINSRGLPGQSKWAGITKDPYKGEAVPESSRGTGDYETKNPVKEGSHQQNPKERTTVLFAELAPKGKLAKKLQDVEENNREERKDGGEDWDNTRQLLV